jgi:hypothetical protein
MAAVSTTFASSLPGSTSTGPGSSTRRARSSGRSYKFYAGIGYSLQTKASYPSTTDAVTVGSYLSETNYNDNANIEFGTSYLPNYSLGLLLGINYEMEKKLKDSKQNGVTFPSDDSSLQVTNIMVGTAFRFDNVYIPVSAIYSLVSIKKPSTFSGNYDAKGGLGGQAGLGVLLTDRFSFEWLYRYNAISLKTTTAANVVQDFGDGNLTSFDLLFKFYF